MDTAKRKTKNACVRTVVPARALGIRVAGLPVLTAFLMMTTTSPVPAQSGARHLSLASVVAAPAAARDLCVRYAWACGRTRGKIADHSRMIAIATEVNRRINRKVRPVDDIAQYHVEDYWTLPSSRGGDCEDVALFKKQELVARGVPADRLLLATVFSKKVGAHAVLVLRLDEGDFVLDSLNTRIEAWHQTGYTFLRMQNPDAPGSWVRVTAGG